jgi:hypothetical protein
MTRSETLAETMSIVRFAPHGHATRTRRILSAVIAALTALAIVTAGAAPARADDRMIAQALLAIGAIAVIGSLDKDNTPQKAKPKAVQQRPVATPTHAPAYGRSVPQSCAITIAGDRNKARFFTESCLRRSGFAYRLPQNCARSARIYGRNDRIYSDQCLRNAGFRFDAPPRYVAPRRDWAWDNARRHDDHDDGHHDYRPYRYDHDRH